MDYGELMAGGFKLMVFGMGMVYVFLVIMIVAMKVLEVVLRPFATLLDPPAAAPAAKRAQQAQKTPIWQPLPLQLWQK